MANKADYFPFANISATTTGFVLRGGNYGLTAHAGTWGTGIVLQRLAVDNTTWINVITALTADGYVNLNLPSGNYRLQLTGVSGLYADITSVTTTQ
jgi:hypothetical protein